MRFAWRLIPDVRRCRACTARTTRCSSAVVAIISDGAVFWAGAVAHLGVEGAEPPVDPPLAASARRFRQAVHLHRDLAPEPRSRRVGRAVLRLIWEISFLRRQLRWHFAHMLIKPGLWITKLGTHIEEAGWRDDRYT